MADTLILVCIYAPAFTLWIVAEILTARAKRLHNSPETKSLNAEFERRVRELKDTIP